MLNDHHQPFLIRRYRRSDRDAVRKLCCDTGFLGDPIDPVYEDRELFADFLTTYYTNWEPESSFVIEKDGEIRGYLLGSRKPLLNQLYSFWQNVSLFLKALTRYFRQAHFYYFAGSWQVPLLIAVAALAGISALSGLYLNLSRWSGKLFKRS